MKQDERRSRRLSIAAFPVAQRGDREPEAPGELSLRDPHALAQRTDIERLAQGMGAGAQNAVCIRMIQWMQRQPAMILRIRRMQMAF